MTEPVAILLRDSKDRYGIRLKREYLQSWVQASSVPINNNNRDLAVEELKSDFLAKDIQDTSIAIIPEQFGQSDVDTFPPEPYKQGRGVVLQIIDTEDIGNSAFSLLNKLNNLTPVRQVYIERDDDEDVDIPRGLLRWTLSDGNRQVQAMEMETIPELNLKTPFGCKLLIRNCQVLRGMLMLTPDSVTVLCGDLPELYGNDMTKELKRRLQAKLDANRAPGTPLPTAANTTPSRRPINTASLPINTYPTPSYTASSYTRTTQSTTSSFQPQSSHPPPTSEFSPEDLNQIFNDDDFGIDIDEPINNNNNNNNQQEQHTPQNIPQNSFANTMDDVDSDDDFVMTQPIPKPRFAQSSAPTPSLSLSKKRTSSSNSGTQQVPSSSNISLSKKRSQSTSQESPTIQQKRNQPSTSSTAMEVDENEEMIVAVKKEKGRPGDSFLEITADDDEEEDEEDKYATYNFRDGKYHTTFEKLKALLSAMQRDESINLSFDLITVQARWMRLAKFRYGYNGGLWGIVNVNNPDTKENCCSSAKLNSLCTKCIQIIIRNQMFGKILDLDVNEKDKLDLIMKTPKGQKQITRFMNSHHKEQIVELELDVTLIQKWQGEDGKADGPIMLPVQDYKFLPK